MKQKQSNPALSRLNHYNGWVRRADCEKNKHWQSLLAASRNPHLGNNMDLALWTLNTKIILIAIYAVVKNDRTAHERLVNVGLPWTALDQCVPCKT